MITGFRVALGGAQELTGVVPDLATYAKSLAGGFPIAMLLGRPDIMEMLGDGRVQHGGSFNSNVMSVEAARACLAHIMADSVGFYRDLEERGNRLIDGLQLAAREVESDLRVHGLGSVFSTSFTTRADIDDYRDHAMYCDEEKYQRFRVAMVETRHSPFRERPVAHGVDSHRRGHRADGRSGERCP